MVLGMAVPTAFAAGNVYNATRFIIHGATPTGSNWLAAGNQLTISSLVVGADDPYWIDLYNGNGSAPFKMFTDATFPKVKTTVSDVDADKLTVEVGDGWIKIAAKALFDEPTTFKLKVASTKESGTWGDGWSYEDYFNGEITVSASAPRLIAGSKLVVLDLAEYSTSSQTLSFTGIPNAGTLSDIDLSTVSGTYSTANRTGTYARVQPYGTTWQVFGTAVGEQTIYAKGKVDDVNSGEISFTVRVIDSSSETAQTYKTDKEGPTGLKVSAKNPSAGKHTFKLWTVNGSGTKVADVATANAPSFAFTADTAEGTQAGTALTGANFAMTAAGTVDLIVPQGLVKAKGTLKMTKSGMLSHEIPVEIEAVNLSSNVQKQIVIDKKQSSSGVYADLTAEFKLSTTDVDGLIHAAGTATTSGAQGTGVAFASSDITIGASGIVIVAKDAVNFPDVYTVTLNSSVAKGEYKFTAQGTLNNAAKTTTDIIEIKLVVDDTTSKPKLSIAPATITLDAYTLSQKTATLGFGITGGFAGSQLTPTEWKFVDKDDTVVTSYVGFTPNAAQNSIAVTAVAKYDKTVYASVKVDGVWSDPVLLTVKITDADPTKPDHYVATPSSVTKSLSEKTAEIKVQLFNAKGETIAIDSSKVSVVDDEDKASTIASFTASSTPGSENPKNDIYTVAFDLTKSGGKAFLKFADTGIDTFLVPITINPVQITADKTSLAYDKVNVDTDAAQTGYTNKQTVTFTAPTGMTINSYAFKWANASYTTPGTDPFKITLDTNASTANKKVFDIRVNTATTAKKGDLTFVAVVDNYNSNEIKVPVTISDSQGFIVSPTEFKFSMRDGGKQTGTFTIGKNPANGVVTGLTVASSDTKIVTVEESATANTYKVTAVAPGSAVITVGGKINAKVVPTVSINVYVDTDPDVVTLIPTPASATLYLKSTTANAVTFTAKGSNGVAATDLAFAAYTGDIMKVEGLKVTGLKAGTANLTLNGKVAGVALSTTVTITVKDEVAPVTEGIYIGDVLYKSGDTFYVPNNYKAVQTAWIVTYKNASGVDVAVSSVTEAQPKGKAKRFNVNGKQLKMPANKLYFGETTLKVKPTGMSSISLKLNVARKPEIDNTNVLTGLTEAQTGTKGFFFDYVTSNPSDAYYTQPRFWNFQSTDTAVATFQGKNTGVIKFLKAGKVTLTATAAKTSVASKVASFSVEITVNDEYKNTKLYGAVLSATPDKVVTALKAQAFPKGNEVTGYPITVANYYAMIEDLKSKATMNDITAIYINAPITKSGVDLGLSLRSLKDVAKDLSVIPGKIFLTLNGAASTFYGKSAADPVDVAKAFADVEAAIREKSPITNANDNRFWSGQKFYVLSGTATQKKNSVSDSKKATIESEFVKALTPVDGKFPNGGTTVTLKQLYDAINATTNTAIGFYPQSGGGLNVGYITPIFG